MATPRTYDEHLVAQAEQKATGRLVHDFNHVRACYFYAATAEEKSEEGLEASLKAKAIREQQEERLRVFVATGVIPKYKSVR